jgi:nucleotide-binding universal stress UspA family protein
VIRTILVVVDDTKPSQQAASVAVELAAAVGAQLVAVSVIDDGERSSGGPASSTSTDAAHLEAVRAAQDRVRRLAAGTGLRGIDLRTIHSHAVDSLLKEARDAGADLVVVPRLEARDNGTAVMAPSAARMLEHGVIPVLVVPAAP